MTKKYTETDLQEFDILTQKISSHNQLERIDGRLKFAEFSKKFDRETLDEMFVEIVKRETE